MANNAVIAQLVIYCSYSEDVSEDLGATAELFYEMDWYRLSDKMKKLYILSIARGQKEFRLTGLGIIECSLRIFAKVTYDRRIFEALDIGY